MTGLGIGLEIHDWHAGTHPLIELATAPALGSGLEELAVVIITAPDVSADDPRVLISANIHGPEICPCIVAHAPRATAAPVTDAHARPWPSMSPIAIRFPGLPGGKLPKPK